MVRRLRRFAQMGDRGRGRVGADHPPPSSGPGGRGRGRTSFFCRRGSRALLNLTFFTILGVQRRVAGGQTHPPRL